MTGNYYINLMDPDKTPIRLVEFTTNGTRSPASETLDVNALSASTSLLLYGHGSPNFGERIQENIVNILENFSGDIEPKYPTEGQLWYRVDKHILTQSGWFKWDGSSWSSLTVSTTPTNVDGSYYTINGELYEYINRPTHQISPYPIKHKYINLPNVVDPNVEGIPVNKSLLVYNSSDGWSEITNTFVSDNDPIVSFKGAMWFKPNTSELLIDYTGASSWYNITDKFLKLTGGTLSGNVDIGSNSIFNTKVPTLDSELTNKKYVDDTIVNTITGFGGVIPNTLDDLQDVQYTLSGPVANQFLKWDQFSNSWLNSTISITDISQWPLTVDVLEIATLDGISGNIQTQLNSKFNSSGGTLSGSLDMSGHDILNIPTPTNSDYTKAANVQFVLNEIAAIPPSTNDTYISQASIVGTSLNSGQLNFWYNTNQHIGDPAYSDVIVPTDISKLGHTHSAVDVSMSTHPLGVLVDNYPSSQTQTALSGLDILLKKRTTPTRKVVSNTTASISSPSSTDSTPEYQVGSNKLFIYINGLKKIANTHAVASILLNGFPDVFGDTGLASGTTYNMNISVNGSSPVNCSVTPSYTAPLFYSYYNLISDLAAVVPTGVTVEWGAYGIDFISNTSGNSSSISITSGANDISNNLADYQSTTPAGSGKTYDYSENGQYGSMSSQITYTTTITQPYVMESIIIGSTGINV